MAVAIAVGVGVGVLTPAILGLARAWQKRYWKGTANRLRNMRRVVGKVRRMVLARKRTRFVARREFMSCWHKAPLWLLRATLFRWFEDCRTTDWPYVEHVHKNHSNDEARTQAAALLWEPRAVEDLKPRDLIWDDQHVVLVHPCSGVFYVVSEDTAGSGRSPKHNAGAQIDVKQGWWSQCSRTMRFLLSLRIERRGNCSS